LLEASALMAVEKKRAAELSQRPAPAPNEPRKLHYNPNCGSWANSDAEQRALRDAGRDEDFRTITDSKATPEERLAHIVTSWLVWAVDRCTPRN